MTYHQWQTPRAPISARMRPRRRRSAFRHAAFARLENRRALRRTRPARRDFELKSDEQQLANALEQLKRRVPLAPHHRACQFLWIGIGSFARDADSAPRNRIFGRSRFRIVCRVARASPIWARAAAPFPSRIKNARPDIEDLGDSRFRPPPSTWPRVTRRATKPRNSFSCPARATGWSPLENLGALRCSCFQSALHCFAAHIENLQPEVRLYEPRGALDGGVDGLDPYRVFAERADGSYLRARGFCAVELGDGGWEKTRGTFQ